MKKIGICTLYYMNRNYGANLQAYALQSVLEKLGAEAQVIPYYHGTKLRRCFSGIKQRIRKKDRVASNIAVRNAAIDGFRNTIPHSKCYFSNTIDTANADFDGFITGSDQVWNPDWINGYMALQFADESKLTAAYAASTGRITLDAVQKEKLRVAMGHTKHISIREKESIPALRELTDKEIDCVLDPTMLLTRAQWDKICSDRIVEGEYLFCYFLGGNENLRKAANDYARKNHLKVVTLPYLNAAYRQVDDGFGDEQLYHVSPKDFLSLIKHASFVLTDSFHAAVFSHIYGKEFAVSGNKENEMGCRMQSLTELFGTGNRYFRDFEMLSAEALCALNEQPMKLNYEKYEEMRNHSLDFLKKVLKDDG